MFHDGVLQTWLSRSSENESLKVFISYSATDTLIVSSSICNSSSFSSMRFVLQRARVGSHSGDSFVVAHNVLYVFFDEAVDQTYVPVTWKAEHMFYSEALEALR